MGNIRKNKKNSEASPAKAAREGRAYEKYPDSVRFPAVADIVRSEAGRDQGRCFMVIAVEQEYVRLCDGDYRRIEKPKRKKIKHVRFVGVSEMQTTQKLLRGDSVQNSEIRRAFNTFFAVACEQDDASTRHQRPKQGV